MPACFPSRAKSESTRDAILQAAVREFSNEGLAGARTDAIAKSANVNKAMLYYYFEDKDALHLAVLEQVFDGLRNNIHSAMSSFASPSQRILAYAEAHFDYIAGHPLYPRIVQAEMMRAGRGNTRHLDRVLHQYLHSIFLSLRETVEEGIAREEFRNVDSMHFITSMIAVIVFHFNSARIMHLMTGVNPMSPESLAARRAAVLDFISAALFKPELERKRLKKAGKKQ